MEKKEKILCVDDEKQIVISLRALLRSCLLYTSLSGRDRRACGAVPARDRTIVLRGDSRVLDERPIHAPLVFRPAADAGRGDGGRVLRAGFSVVLSVLGTDAGSDLFSDQFVGHRARAAFRRRQIHPVHALSLIHI